MRRIGVLAALVLMGLAPRQVAAEGKRLFVMPPIQWDEALSRDRQAQTLGSSDLANLTGGITFGMSPAQVNARLPAPAPGVEWGGLPSAGEYPEDVRYFWVRLDALKDPRKFIQGCAGANSYVVFLFRERGLFRISWRLLPDGDCASPLDAARDVFARYLSIDGRAALAVHYRPNKADVVDVTDPNAGYLIPYRWENRQRR